MLDIQNIEIQKKSLNLKSLISNSIFLISRIKVGNSNIYEGKMENIFQCVTNTLSHRCRIIILKRMFKSRVSIP